MTEAQQFFLCECIAHVRELKLADAVLFLRGMLESVEDEALKSPIQNAFVLLTESDRQLELIQSGQLKLRLPAEGKPNGGQS